MNGSSLRVIVVCLFFLFNLYGSQALSFGLGPKAPGIRYPRGPATLFIVGNVTAGYQDLSNLNIRGNSIDGDNFLPKFYLQHGIWIHDFSVSVSAARDFFDAEASAFLIALMSASHSKRCEDGLCERDIIEAFERAQIEKLRERSGLGKRTVNGEKKNNREQSAEDFDLGFSTFTMKKRVDNSSAELFKGKHFRNSWGERPEIQL